MAKAVRMADIAQRLGISTVSVSKGLAGKEGVSAEMRAKILAVAEEMGYQPLPGRIHSPAARASVFWWQIVFSTRTPFIPICTGRCLNAPPSRTSRC